MRRTCCSACGCDNLALNQFLDLGESPVADAYTTTPDPPPVYPLQVAVCGKCQLVQLLDVLDDEQLYGSGYSFHSSASPQVSAYHVTYAAQVLARYAEQARRGVVEVACNDGDLLRYFTGFPTLGVDPAEGPAAVARDRGLDVLVRPFGLAAAHEIVDRRGRQGLVIANHVLAHVADVADVLAGIRVLLDDDGVAIVEVQYLSDLLVNNAFDLVYHEHRNFFSLTTLERAAAQHGLYVVGAELTDRQGGSLRVRLAQRKLNSWGADDIRAAEGWLTDFAAYAGMQGRAERIRTRLHDLLSDAGQVAGYGAPAKATTLLNFCGIDRRIISHVVDAAPAKQGRYIPGTGIPIVAPGSVTWTTDPETYLLLAWNYAGSIMRANPGNRWIVPLPAPVML